MIRQLLESDVEAIRKIHQKHFADEFEFPDFLHGFYCAFVIEDGVSKKIVTAGGIRPIAESVLVTDLDLNPRDRKVALLNGLQASIFTAQGLGFNEIHAFIQNEKWLKRLERTGFKRTKGQSLVLGL